MSALSAFVVGLVFGVGLIVSGMSDPAKVLAFLDVAGAWDPSLALVMVGAIAVGAVSFAIAARRNTTWLGHPMRIPQEARVDRRLLAGSALFGVGWGLAGICPGPALVLVGAALPKGVVYFAAMLAGMVLFELLQHFGPDQVRREIID